MASPVSFWPTAHRMARSESSATLWFTSASRKQGFSAKRPLQNKAALSKQALIVLFDRRQRPFYAQHNGGYTAWKSRRNREPCVFLRERAPARPGQEGAPRRFRPRLREPGRKSVPGFVAGRIVARRAPAG